MPAVAHEALPAPRRERRITVGPLVLSLPAALTMLILFVTPLAVFAAYSFLSGTLFQVSRPWTLENYREALNSNLNHVLAKNSLVVGLLSASVTLALGLPIAYWLRYAAGRWRTLVLFLITATLFASYLVRIYAWRSILGQSGLLNQGFSGSGSSTTRLASCSTTSSPSRLRSCTSFCRTLCSFSTRDFRRSHRPSSNRHRISGRTPFFAGVGLCYP